jgi:hypothetical protein
MASCNGGMMTIAMWKKDLRVIPSVTNETWATLDIVLTWLISSCALMTTRLRSSPHVGSGRRLSSALLPRLPGGCCYRGSGDRRSI